MEIDDVGIGLLIALVLMLCGVCIWAFRQHRALKRYRDRESVWLKRLEAAREMSLVNEITAVQTLAMIEKTSALKAWWIPTSEELVSEHQVQEAPFWIDHHIASMALHTQKPIHQHQMLHTDWAFAYIPKVEDEKLIGLFAIASSPDAKFEDQKLEEKWVEFLCVHW